MCCTDDVVDLVAADLALEARRGAAGGVGGVWVLVEGDVDVRERHLAACVELQRSLLEGEVRDHRAPVPAATTPVPRTALLL